MEEIPTTQRPEESRSKNLLEAFRSRYRAARANGWTLPRNVRRGITLLLTLFALFVLGRMIFTQWDNLRAYPWQIHPAPLLGSFLLYGIYIGFGALIWANITRTVGSPATLLQHIRIYYISTLANRIPLPMSYIASRLLLYDERTSKTALSFASGLELGLIILSGMGIGLIFWPQTDLLISWKGGLLILALGLAGVHPRVLNRLLLWLKVRPAGEVRYSRTLFWFLLYCLIWLAGGCVLFLVVASIYPLPIALLPDVIGAWTFSGLVAILVVFLPIGLGVREAAMGVLLANFLPPGIAAVAAILSRLLLTVYEILFAGLALLIKAS